MVQTAQILKLTKEVKAKPLSEWQTVAVELLGTQTRMVQGHRFHHRVIECGTSGEPLLLIHGIGGHGETYARSLHNLAKNGFHVYAIDALYHGFSSKEPQVQNRTALQAEALADLIRALGYSWAHVEGESMGGAIVQEFALMFPEMCGKLIMNTGGGFNVNLKKKDFKQNPGGGPTLQELSQRSVTNPNFETVRKRMEWLVASPERMTDEMVNIRLRLYSFPEIYKSMQWVYRIGQTWTPEMQHEEEDLKKIKANVLVFWTEKNPGQAPDYGEYLAGLIPGAKFYNMLDAAHWPQWEKPEQHDQVLIDFIKG